MKGRSIIFGSLFLACFFDERKPAENIASAMVKWVKYKLVKALLSSSNTETCVWEAAALTPTDQIRIFPPSFQALYHETRLKGHHYYHELLLGDGHHHPKIYGEPSYTTGGCLVCANFVTKASSSLVWFF